MDQCGWDNSPEGVRGHVESFITMLEDVLADDLTGVYLHGSLAMGCFTPARSDIDLLVVNRQTSSKDQIRAITRYLLDHSGTPIPFEMSLLNEAELFPWRYPTPYSFHYGEAHRLRLSRLIENPNWPCVDNAPRIDADLAAHITVLRARGITLVGQEIEFTFPVVPRADYIDSIVRDITEARHALLKNPVYAILNMCRVYYYLVEHMISSKDEAGRWALTVLKPRFRPIIQAALACYRAELDMLPFDPIDLAHLAAYLDAHITEQLYQRGYR
ncbi:MAG: aminoglycoside adenylyltransferase domain-containing protein [Chloroflexota bacterium]